MGNASSSQTGTTLRQLLNDPNSPLAWGAFVERYGRKIHTWCRRWGSQDADAEDVTQVVLAKLAVHLRSFAYDRRKGTFRGWLKTVSHNAWRDYVENRARAGIGTGHLATIERLHSLEARDDLARQLEEEFDLEILEIAKVRVQELLSPRDWKIFTDLAVERRSGAEVAAELKMTVTAVLVAKSRVQRKLRDEIQRLEAPELASSEK